MRPQKASGHGWQKFFPPPKPPPPNPCAHCPLLAPSRRAQRIPLASLPEGRFDDPLAQGTGAAVIFGNTGGVMEAALRTAYELAVGGWSMFPPSPFCSPPLCPCLARA